MKFFIEYHGGFFEIRTFGDANPEKIMELPETLVSHEKWKPGTPFLINHSELDTSLLTTADMIEIAKHNIQYSAKFEKAKCAHLFSRDLEFGLGRMWQALVEGEWEVSARLFKSRDEAVAWLTA